MKRPVKSRKVIGAVGLVLTGVLAWFVGPSIQARFQRNMPISSPLGQGAYLNRQRGGIDKNFIGSYMEAFSQPNPISVRVVAVFRSISFARSTWAEIANGVDPLKVVPFRIIEDQATLNRLGVSLTGNAKLVTGDRRNLIIRHCGGSAIDIFYPNEDYTVPITYFIAEVERATHAELKCE
jgi:hypothetical protein